ncbi:DUF882 domain-containing protein [Roseibium polysiphoniae]|uniref:Murein endopeptidase K n=1 Tax=Roseibium polysiphoniae TaxID=2571221 RepID=A0A944CEA8_9HYPH|nr:DUF882 domain-containing protein [Roseibium polysiphoniae]
MRKRLVGFDAVRGLQRVATLLCLLASLPILAIGTASAETRTLKLYNTHTKERVEVTFKKNGRYIPSGLREANRFLRDWRRNEITNIDPKLLDLVWEVYQKVRGKQPIYVVSSYRSPATNNMLRKRSRGVAKNSQHTLGKAMDFYIPGVNLAKLRATGLRQEVGGVGYYPRSGSPFVHMDTGSVRHWPRMSRSQLAKVFPDGKTLHFPSDGKPMKGYKLALAESKSGKKRSNSPTIIASRSPAPVVRSGGTTGQSARNSGDIVRPAPAETQASGGGNLLASLFRNNNSNDVAQRSRVAAVRPNDAPLPPGALPGVRRSGDNSSPAQAAAPVTEAPPIPVVKEGSEPEVAPQADDRIIVAGIVPSSKPSLAPEVPAQADAATQLASAAAPNTLDSQRVALEQGITPTPPAPLADSSRFDVATKLPAQKPADQLVAATQAAALDEQSISGNVPVPPVAPATDPVAAIVAATGGGTVSPASDTLAPATLAYASATAVPSLSKPASAPRSTSSLEAPQLPRPGAATNAVARSVSGRIPLDEIKDPLAGFAGLPDKTEPRLISGSGTTRHGLFASLSHPKQRTLENFLAPGNRFVSGGFEIFPYGALRTDRFDGPAVIVLPVTFAR